MSRLKMADSCGVRTIKYFLVLFNFLIVIIGGALMGLGVHYKLQSQMYTEILTESLQIVPLAIIIIGGVLFLIGFMGCCSVMCELSVLLKIYLIVLLVIWVVQVAAVVVIVHLRSLIETQLSNALLVRALPYYNETNLSMTKAVDKVQSSFKCCGAQGKSDWNGTDWGKAHPDKVPASCCDSYTEGESAPCNYHDGYTTGCAKALNSWVDTNVIQVGLVIGTVLAVQFLLIVCGGCASRSLVTRIVPIG